jgi:uncharacterized OB-fold protein
MTTRMPAPQRIAPGDSDAALTGSAIVPVVDYLVPGDESPHLLAHVCDRCGAQYLARRNGCGQCAGTTFSRRSVEGRGTVKAFTVVWRDAPGIQTPFVSCLVDVGGGLVVKSNLIGIDPAKVDSRILGRPVELVTSRLDADSAGTVAIAFGFLLGAGEHQ